MIIITSVLHLFFFLQPPSFLSFPTLLTFCVVSFISVPTASNSLPSHVGLIP